MFVAESYIKRPSSNAARDFLPAGVNAWCECAEPIEDNEDVPVADDIEMQVFFREDQSLLL